MSTYTLKKKEILSSKILISELFDSGHSQFKYPFKLIYLVNQKLNQDSPRALFSISVPKRNIKTAVERNLIKRRTREAYRLNKHKLFAKIPENKQLVMMFVFVGKRAEPYNVIEKSILQIVKSF